MIDGMQAMERLASALPESASSRVDAPDDREKGTWFLDVTLDGQLEVVAWKAGVGYGLWDMPEPTYGQNPNLVVAEPAQAVAAMLGIMERARGTPSARP